MNPHIQRLMIPIVLQTARSFLCLNELLCRNAFLCFPNLSEMECTYAEFLCSLGKFSVNPFNDHVQLILYFGSKKSQLVNGIFFLADIACKPPYRRAIYSLTAGSLLISLYDFSSTSVLELLCHHVILEDLRCVISRILGQLYLNGFWIFTWDPKKQDIERSIRH